MDSFCYARLMDKIPYEQLLDMVASARNKVKPGSLWQHYRGGQFVVSDIAVMESGNEPAVVYSAAEQPQISFIRPLSEWSENVDWNGQTHQRFTPLS
jgi:hypothetical protein